MPNHVDNRLIVCGLVDDVQRFVLAVGERSICDALLPLPDGVLIERTAPDGSTYTVFADRWRDGVDGYQMAVDLWGTKWGDYRTKLHGYVPGCVEYRYQTAWSPMTVALIRLSEMWPTLLFGESFVDEAPNFAGFCTVHGRNVRSVPLDVSGCPPFDEDNEDAWLVARDEWLAKLADDAQARVVTELDRLIASEVAA